MKRDDPRLQKRILRLMAAVSLPMLPAVIAPRLVLEKMSWLPEAPLLFYITAGGSLVYLILCGLLWMISCDVVRYRPLILFTAWASLLARPVYWWIDTHTGMPRWWMLMDALRCVIGGLALLWASGRGDSVLHMER